MIVLDAESGSVLGCAEIELWNRTKKADERYQRLPIEEKESYRWITTAESARKVLSAAECVTFIGDRENDIYEFLDRIPKQNTHLRTRVCKDRLIVNSNYNKLYKHLDNTEEAGRIRIEIPRDIRLGRQKREALLAIKRSVIEIRQPKNCSDKSASKSIKLHVVEAKELDCPNGQDPVHWRLYTTHSVNDFSEAKQIILWYRMRWTIEHKDSILRKVRLNQVII